MKIQILVLLLSFLAIDSFSQKNKSNHDFTNVHHYRSNITLKNFDGTRSSIHVSGSSARLTNSDGTQSTIDFGGGSSTLIAINGTISTVLHSRFSSTVYRPDGTQIIINHMQNTSSCSAGIGKHTLSHTFGFICEISYKNKIDVLIHINWLLKKEALKTTAEGNAEATQN